MKNIYIKSASFILCLLSFQAFGGVNGSGINIGKAADTSAPKDIDSEGIPSSNNSAKFAANSYQSKSISTLAGMDSFFDTSACACISSKDIRGFAIDPARDRLVIKLSDSVFNNLVNLIEYSNVSTVTVAGDNMQLLEVIYDSNQRAVAMVMEDSYGEQVIVRIK